MNKAIFNTLIIIYIIISIGATLFLISANDYGVVEFKDKIIMPIGEKVDKLNAGSLVIIKSDNKLEVGNKVYYFNSINKLSVGKIETLEDEVLFANGDIVTKDKFVGNSKDVVEIPIIGFLLSVLTSKLGYLTLVILPVFLIFVYEVYLLIKFFKSAR